MLLTDKLLLPFYYHCFLCTFDIFFSFPFLFCVCAYFYCNNLFLCLSSCLVGIPVNSLTISFLNIIKIKTSWETMIDRFTGDYWLYYHLWSVPSYNMISIQNTLDLKRFTGTSVKFSRPLSITHVVSLNFEPKYNGFYIPWRDINLYI